MTCRCPIEALRDILGIQVKDRSPFDGPDRDGWALYVGHSAWWEPILYCPLCGGTLADRLDTVSPGVPSTDHG